VPRRLIRNLPNRLRYWRNERGYSLRAIADFVDLAFPSIGKIETGDAPLKVEHLREFARILGVTPADLLNESDGGLSIEEREIITILRGLPQANREALVAAVRSQLPFCST